MKLTQPFLGLFAFIFCTFSLNSYAGGVVSSSLKDVFSSGLGTNLHDLIRDGDRERGLFLIAVEPDTIDRRDVRGATPLMIAAFSRQIEFVRALIDAGADVNAGDIQGLTALMLAVKKNDRESVRALIEAGANVNASTSSGVSVLNFVLTSHMAQVLIDAGVHVNVRDDRGRTPLVSALLMKNNFAARALIEAGADVEARDSEGLTAFALARFLKNVEMVNYIKRREIIEGARQEQTLCPISHEEFNEGDEVKLLSCNHLFRKAAVSEWLSGAGHGCCPVCRAINVENKSIVGKIPGSN